MLDSSPKIMNSLIKVGWNLSKPAVRGWNLSEEEFATKIWRLNETELQDLYNQVKLDNLGQDFSIGIDFIRNPSIFGIPSAISKRTNQKNRLELIKNRMNSKCFCGTHFWKEQGKTRT